MILPCYMTTVMILYTSMTSSMSSILQKAVFDQLAVNGLLTAQLDNLANVAPLRRTNCSSEHC